MNVLACLGGTDGARRTQCADVGYQGACLGGVLVWAEDGQCKTYDCGARGLGCGDDGVNGNNCL